MSPRTLYTLTATDADGDTDTYTFHLAVEDDTAPDFDSASAVDLKFTVGGEIPPTQLPTADNGNGTLEYTTTALPGGLRFNARTRRISGTPATVQPRTQYSLTVRDYDGDTATFNYYITIEGIAFANPPVIDRTFIAGTEITSFQLPEATATGGGALTYSTTALPVGLTFDPATRTVSGTPVATQARTLYKLTAVDGDGNSGTYDFYITIEGVTFDSPPEIDVTYTVGSEINPPLQLPSAIVGAGTLTYSTTALPEGLSFDSATRRISGMPNTLQERTVYTLTATDGVNSATFDFHITVEGIVFAGLPVIDRTFIVGTEITSFQLPEATGGGTLTYSTTALPAGLTFDPATRRIRGTPNTRQARTRYILTATDGVNSATFDFYIAVDNLTFAWPVIDKLFVVGAGVTSFQLPEATGGVGSVTYTTTALPTGLAFEPSTRRISGTLSVTQARTGYTLTAVDGDGNRATYDFYITVVNESARPTFGSTAPIDWTFTPENISGGLSLPQAVGGAGRLTYAMNPALPVGLSFNAQNLSLGLSDNRYARTTVNFPAALPRTEYTLTATDENGDQATWAFHITVKDIEPDFNTPPTIDSVFISGLRPRQYGEEDIIFLPRALGNGAITYEVSSTSLPDLRSGPFPFHPFPHHLHDGLFFEAHDLLLVIDSPAMLTRTQYTLTATDADGDTATWTFHLTVEENTAPDFSAVSEIDMTFSPGAEISPIQLPEATGGNRPLIGYTITSGTLPPGLVFNTLSRTISGTPVSGQGKTRLVMTATDRNGDTAEFTFHITIEGIAFVHSPVIDKTFVVDTEITSFQLPEAEATGGGNLIYSTTPLPDGLIFDPATRRISGTPVAAQARTLYTLTAVDGVGNSGIFYFHITVQGVTFDSPPEIDVTYTVGSEINPPLQLPSAIVSAGTLTYSTTALPEGLSFDPATRRISGTPNTRQGKTVYTLTAT
ncbi:MAG: putative Ig domain-containing protein, partial [Candidatus Dadabacteria bacterium]|nr:putative Ig domain-containing protein [Candidatus Dadabacteria bacterium]